MGGWNFIDRTGMRFGKLTVIEYLGNRKWKCVCDCGNTCCVDSSHLSIKGKRHRQQSCGCGLNPTTNIRMFEKIDAEDKAYFLGFLAADGVVDSQKNQVKLVVQQRDKSILEFLKHSLQTTNKIRNFVQKCRLPQGGFSEGHFSALSFGGKEIVRDLINLGVTPAKSLTLNIDYNQIPADLLGHFWRGLIDGDGCFGIYGKRNLLELSLTTSKTMCESTKDKLQQLFPDFHIHYYHAIGCSDSTYRFYITSQKNILQFLNYIYKDSTIYLSRKHENYLKILEEKSSLINCNDYPQGVLHK